MEVVLNKRSGQGGSLSYEQVDSNWGAIEAAFAAIVAGNSGTVTSVGISAPSIFSVSGSPVTSSGTLSLTLATQAANIVWAGPTTGSAAAPTFRALVSADLPTIPLSKLATTTASRVAIFNGSGVLEADSAVTTTELSYLDGVTSAIQTQLNAKVGTSDVIAVNRGGTGANTAQGGRLALLPNVATNGLKVLRVNSGATDVEYATLAVGTAGNDVAYTNSGTTYTLNIPSASGTARGVVTTGAQTFAGQKTFTSVPKITVNPSNTVQYLNSTQELVGEAGFDYGRDTPSQLRVPNVKQTSQTRLTASGDLDLTMSYIISQQAAAAVYDLPTADETTVGHWYFIKDSLGNASTRSITLRPDGTDKIDNVNANKVIGTNYGYIGVIGVEVGGTYAWEVYSASGVS
jgi:hypothetical protein